MRIKRSRVRSNEDLIRVVEGKFLDCQGWERSYSIVSSGRVLSLVRNYQSKKVIRNKLAHCSKEDINVLGEFFFFFFLKKKESIQFS